MGEASTHIGSGGPRRKRARLAGRLPVALPARFTSLGVKPLLCCWPECEEVAQTEVMRHPRMYQEGRTNAGRCLTPLCRLHRHQLDRLSIGEIAVIAWQPRRRKR